VIPNYPFPTRAGNSPRPVGHLRNTLEASSRLSVHLAVPPGMEKITSQYVPICSRTEGFFNPRWRTPGRRIGRPSPFFPQPYGRSQKSTFSMFVSLGFADFPSYRKNQSLRYSFSYLSFRDSVSWLFVPTSRPTDSGSA